MEPLANQKRTTTC